MFGPVVRITYGKSECVNPITVLTAAQTQAYFESNADLRGACVGYAAPGVELKIVASRQSDEHDDTGEGEVWLKAPHMSLGMLSGDGFVPHEPDGWHQTGDLGYIDTCGRLVLTGRQADVIKTGGYRVNPNEIEVSLAALQCPIEMCVTSLPSDYWGEIIIAVGLPGFNAWQERAKCLVSKLSRHKQPGAYVELEKLPRNPQGKISRRLVRQQVLLSYDLIDGPYPKLEPKGQSA
jgi:acyl-CoA synthetase (AMP-forming)/AMP-acid ligase II